MQQDLFDVLTEYIVENQARLYRVAYGYVNNRDNALDVVQNAICKALENYGSLRNTEAIKTWMYRIIVNESLTFLKKNKREIPLQPEDMQGEIYVERAYDPDVSVLDQVRKLPTQMQTVIFLHYYEEMTLKEISLITDVNLSTVKTRLYSALGKLKRNIAE